MKVCEVLDSLNVCSSLQFLPNCGMNDDGAQTGGDEKYCNLQNSIYYAVAAVSRAIFSKMTY